MQNRIDLSVVIEHLPHALAIFSPDWTPIQMNLPFRKLSGASDDKYFDYKSWLQELIPAGPEKTSDHATTKEYVLMGEPGDLNLRITEIEILDASGRLIGYSVTLQDETLQKSFERQIMHASHVDELTELRNRRYFYQKLSEKDRPPFWLVYMDLDHFKEINDTHGHLVGDKVLIETADLIRGRFLNMMIARLGGDEFAVAYTGTEEDLRARCAALEHDVEESFRRYNCGTTISIGAVYSDSPADDLDYLLREGDRQMYAEKEQHHRHNR